MNVIENKGNAVLLGVTEKNNKKLWNKLTKNGQIWENYKDTMAQNRAEVLAVRYGKKVIPLIANSPNTNPKSRIPHFRVHSGDAHIALEAEVKKGKLYLLREAFNPSSEYGRIKWNSVLKFSLKTRNYKRSDGYLLNGSAQKKLLNNSFQEKYLLSAYSYFNGSQYQYLWDELSGKFDFFEEFGGNSTKNKGKVKGKKYTLVEPSKYNKKYADKITNFKASRDSLRIDAGSFGATSSFKSAKNRKALKKLSRKDFDFLYDQQSGGLYYNENGAKKGFGDGGIIAILKGAPDLTSKNVKFI